MAKKEKKGKEPEAEKPEAAPEGAEGEAAPKKKMAGKTLILFIVLPALLVVGGGGAAAMMLLGGGKKTEVAEGEHAGADGHAKADDHGKKADKKKDAKKKDDHGGGKDAGHAAGGEADVGHLTVGEDGEPSYYSMPKIIVNLASTEDGNRPQLLELALVLESGDPANFDNIGGMMPRLMDTFQSFLRELRVEDLDGSQGSYRLRLELLKRFNLVMAPEKVDAVLIEGMLVQ